MPFDPKKMLKDAPTADDDLPPDPPDDEPDDEPEDEPTDEPGDDDPDDESGDDPDDDDDSLTLEELDKRIRAASREELDRRAREEKEREAEDDPDADERDKEIRRLKRENAALLQEREALARKNIENEVLATMKKFRMTQEEAEIVAKWFEKNPDREDVISFQRAALQLLPELASRAAKPNRNGHAPARARTAEVIERGSSGAGAARPIKTTPGRGSYSDVLAGLNRAGVISKSIRIR